MTNDVARNTTLAHHRLVSKIGEGVMDDPRFRKLLQRVGRARAFEE